MKIAIQAGHKGMIIGAVGAPGERDWNSKVVSLIAALLRAEGFEVKEVPSNADKDSKVTSTDWDLFLAIHYDADIYKTNGGFVDTPDPSVDVATRESNRIASILRKNYFPKLGIPEHPERSNANTKFYYMWSALSAKTPCVLIECGIGNRKPEDYNILHDKINDIAKVISDSIIQALKPTVATISKYETFYKKVKELIASTEAQNG
jgi:N-acetylmuramoyl-L-alanine amidase